MRLFILLFILQLGFLLHGQNKIIVGGDYNYPPYSFINEQGVEVGYDVDVIKAIASEIGMDVEFHFTHWDSTLQNLVDNKIDVIASIVYSSEREKKYDFTFPLHTEYYAVFAKKTMQILDINDLTNKRPAYLKGDISNTSFLKPMGLLSDSVSVNSLPEAFVAIVNNSCDYVVAPYPLGMKIMHEKGFKNIEVKGPPIIPSVYCLAVKNGNSDLLAQLNLGIERLSRNGELDKIYQKWVRFKRQDDQYKSRFKWSLWILIGLLFVILIMFVFWYSLKMQVAKKAQQIKDAEEIYQKVFNSVDDLLIVFNREGVVVDANQKAMKLYNHHYDSIVGKKYVDIISPENIELFQGLVDSYVSSDFSFTGEVTKIIKGKKVWLEVRGVRLKLDDEERYLAVLHDVTEERMSRIKLEEAKQLSDEANNTKTTFLGTISHEMRTPLNAVLGFTAMLANTKLTERQNGLKQKIELSGKRLLALFNDVLDITKLEARRLKLNESPFILKNMITELVSDFIDDADKKGVEIKFEIDKHVADVLVGDKERISQVLHNLMSNAVKFTKGGFVSVRISLENEHLYLTNGLKNSQITNIVFSIKDTGIGISEKQLDELFKPFVQVQNTTSRNYGGTGLGLAVSKQLVELMNGEILVDSVEGQGSVFNVCIPLEIGDLSMLETNVDDYNSIPSELLKGTKILLVEDNDFNAEIITEFVSETGFKVERATSGLKAIEMVKINWYQLVLMDIEMPELDGFETTLRLRDLLGHQLPIIALSAHSLDAEKKRAKQVGMNDYLIKPVRPENLISTINKWVSKSSTISWSNGLENFDNNFALFKKALVRFYKSYSEIPAKIEQLGKSNNDDLKHITHNLKSASKMIGANDLAILSKEIDQKLQNQDCELCQPEMEQLVGKLKKVLLELNAYV